MTICLVCNIHRTIELVLSHSVLKTIPIWAKKVGWAELFKVWKLLHALHLYNHAKSKTFDTFMWIVLARTWSGLDAIKSMCLYGRETTIHHNYKFLLLQLHVEVILYIMEGSSSHVPIAHDITIFLLGSVHNLRLHITCQLVITITTITK